MTIVVDAGSSDPMNLMQVQSLAVDIAVFADIGTDPPSIQETQDGLSIRFIRQGDPTELHFAGKDAIQEIYSEREVKHASFKALLASERYGNLRDWANKQHTYIESELAAAGSLIELTGLLDGGLQQADSAAIDSLLSSSQRKDSTRVLLIDGPAGIGKTQFIVGLAGERARKFVTDRRPLILHVQSRGRTLSYLYDLIAYSLQRLRLDVTFDQVPVLAKYGLVTIAIDGFDELADAVERALNKDERRMFLTSFVGETARDMAENGSSSISDGTLSWLVEIALPREVPNEVMRILKARCQVVAFFTNDDRKGHRRFFHEKFYEYFLAATLLEIVARGETGKVLGRNILGSSLLETFGDLVTSVAQPDRIKEFLSTSVRLVQTYPPIDRTRKNLTHTGR